MSLYGMIQRAGASGFGYNSTTDNVTEGLDLHGKTYLVTGINSGLGLETIRILSERGATIVGSARSEAKAREAMAGLPGPTFPLACELSEPASVRAAVATVLAAGHRLDAIIANAGVMALPERTVHHGLEMQFLTNHIGHSLLVTGLLPALTPTGRVVMLSSAAHWQTYREGVRLDDLDAAKRYTSWGAYGQSKLCNLLFARELAKRLPAGQTANAVHPGVIATNLVRHVLPDALTGLWRSAGTALALKTIPQGAATQVYVATHPAAASITGEYWADCNVHKSSKHGRNDELAAALWAKTEELQTKL